ncbi:MAG: acyl-ACP--UDP-N-acetylglucosamine O-acyltransferase [Planctomycetota bacterium]
MKIHATAIVHPTAEVADGAEIGPFCFVGANVTVGAGTRLIHQVSLTANTSLGRDNVVYPGAVLGGDPQDKKFQGEETWLRIGDANLFRECVTINRGTSHGGGVTRIGDNCLFMAGCHVAHDCTVGNHVTMANSVLLGGHVVVEDGVGFGGVSAVHHYASVGTGAFIGGMTRVLTDAPPYLITEGNPSRVRGLNRVGLLRRGLPEETMAWLKEAYRALFYDGTPKEEAIQRLRSNGSVPPEGGILLDFMARSIAGKKGRQLQP